jgi:hypothetical protein
MVRESGRDCSLGDTVGSARKRTWKCLCVAAPYHSKRPGQLFCGTWVVAGMPRWRLSDGSQASETDGLLYQIAQFTRQRFFRQIHDTRRRSRGQVGSSPGRKQRRPIVANSQVWELKTTPDMVSEPQGKSREGLGRRT